MTIYYRADQIGSLLRPKAVLEARDAYAEGRLGLEQLREIEDRAIFEALERQREIGMDVCTDGEYRRGAFMSDLADAVEGMVAQQIPTEWRGPSGGAMTRVEQVVGGKLRQKRRLTAHETAFMKAHAPGPFKITIPSASQLAAAIYMPGLTEQFYPTRSDLLWELVGVIQREVRAVVDEGVPYVQIDAPRYTYYVDPRLREQLRGMGVDPDQALDEAIAADNACLEGAKREGVTLACHLCRGNRRSHWFAEGGYEPIAEKLLGSLQVDRFLLEYDSERAGGFEPLRFVPRGTSLVLGLVTTKEPRLESQDDLLRRIDEASRYVPLDHLALSPQCGFATVAAGNLLSPDDQWRKLELLVDTARKVWNQS